MQQSLGGNAAHQEAGAAQPGVFFNEGRFEAVLSGADGCRVAAGAASNHNEVVGHASSFYMACQIRPRPKFMLKNPASVSPSRMPPSTMRPISRIFLLAPMVWGREVTLWT